MPRVSALGQMFPGKPTFTETDILDLSSKVYIVTGASSGLGKEVARILYSKNAVVWVAARNTEKGDIAVRSIKEAHPSSTGRLEFLQLDLGDLTTIKKSAETFLAKEVRLDVLINNAGVMMPPGDSKTAQGHEIQLGTNNLGPFLFTNLLTPLLKETARAAPKDSVRVIWISSSAAEGISPRGGVPLDNLDYKSSVFYPYKYGISKAGNYYHSTEYARRHQGDGIVSVSLNPGNLRTELDRHLNFLEMISRYFTVYPVMNGAYTELFAALSKEVTTERTGCWIVPWGRPSDIRQDLYYGSIPEAEGGTGIAQRFWEWSEKQTSHYS